MKEDATTLLTFFFNHPCWRLAVIAVMSRQDSLRIIDKRQTIVWIGSCLGLNDTLIKSRCNIAKQRPLADQTCFGILFLNNSLGSNISSTLETGLRRQRLAALTQNLSNSTNTSTTQDLEKAPMSSTRSSDQK